MCESKLQKKIEAMNILFRILDEAIYQWVDYQKLE